jgi:LacI family transcriptional regulator
MVAVEVAADRPSYESGVAAFQAVLSTRTTAAIAFQDHHMVMSY